MKNVLQVVICSLLTTQIASTGGNKPGLDKLKETKDVATFLQNTHMNISQT